MLKRIVVLLIMPDIRKEDDINNWNTCINHAYELYNDYPTKTINDISNFQRWAIGYVTWKK